MSHPVFVICLANKGVSMRINLNRYIIVLLGCLMCSPAVADQTWPHAALPTGIYASPECSDPKEMWVIAAGHELYADQDTFYLQEISTLGGEIAHGWRWFDGFFARALPSGHVEYVLWGPEDATAQPTEEMWPTLLPESLDAASEQWTGARFVPCLEVPLPFSLMHGESARLLIDVDAAIRACERVKAICARRLFDVADRFHDGELNRADLSRLARVLLHLSVASQEDPAMEVSVAGTLGTMAVAPLVASALIASYDYDGSGALSYDEIAVELLGSGQLSVTSAAASGLTGKSQATIEKIYGELNALLPLLQTLR